MSQQTNQPNKTTGNNPQDRKQNEQPEARKQNEQPEASKNSENPQDQTRRNEETTDKNRVGGDASRTKATQTQDQENTRTQEPNDKAGRH